MKIAVVGATGMVGEVLLSLLRTSRFGSEDIRAFASSTSSGASVPYAGRSLPVEELKDGSLSGCELAFFAVGDNLSRQFVPQALEAGCRVVDKSNAFRLQDGVPLLVPGVNDYALGGSPLAANPNCTTIGFVHAIAPLLQFGVEEVAVATYQSLSGAGKGAVRGFMELAYSALAQNPSPYSPDLAMAFQATPAIGPLDGDEHSEETKLRLETGKITHLDSSSIFPTAVRVAVIIGHSMSVHLRLSAEVGEKEILSAFAGNPTLNVLSNGEAPDSGWAIKLPDRVTIGRIRVRPKRRAVDFFAVADNLNIGAALNGLRIAELLFG